MSKMKRGSRKVARSPAADVQNQAELFRESGLNTVDEIIADARDPNLRRVRIRRQTVATLRATDLQTLEISLGTPWTSQLAQQVQGLMAKNAVQKHALRILGKRALSRGELKRRLMKHSDDDSSIDETLDDLERNGWLNDADYAESLAHQTLRRGPVSRQLLIQKLRSHQIAESMARQIADAALQCTTPADAAMQLARSKLPKYAKLARAAAQRRIAGLLARRGFDEDIIAATLDGLFADQHDRDE